jgi:hypothetical protein
MKSAASASSASPSAATRPLIVAVIFFVLGAALAGAWFHFQKSSRTGELPAPVQRSLEQLTAPVVIRFYSLLPAGNGELESFSARVGRLLDAVQTSGHGKIQVTRLETATDANATAAVADGLQPFNLDQGDAAFLGLAVSSGERKETLARLQPEWEAALPCDLARAILRVAAVSASAPPAQKIAPPSPAIVNSIKRLIPDIAGVSTAEADRIFHDEFLKECAAAGTEMEAQINAAQKQVEQAQNGGSPEALAAAQKQLLAVQLQQGEKLKQIAADLQTRLAVFQQMKAGGSPSTP